MTTRLYITSAFILLLGSNFIFGQNFEVTIDQQVILGSPKDRLEVSVYIKALDGAPPKLGTSKFAINVSTVHLMWNMAPDLVADGLWDDTNDPVNYDQQEVNWDRALEWFSVDLNYIGAGAGNGVTVPGTTTLVGTASLDTKNNPSALSGISWRTADILILDESGTDITSNGTFINPPAFPMPVELTSFTGALENGNIILRWSTATEVNNYGFEIERNISEDPSTGIWETIDFVSGYGNSNSPKQYSYADDQISSSGTYHYRLRQIDFDGTFEYSPEVQVDVEVSHKFVLHQNYPNPFNPTTKISFELPIETKVQVTIYNIIGEVVEVLADDVYPRGSHELVFNGDKLAAGIYAYSLQAGNQRLMGKMLLLK